MFVKKTRSCCIKSEDARVKFQAQNFYFLTGDVKLQSLCVQGKCHSSVLALIRQFLLTLLAHSKLASEHFDGENSESKMVELWQSSTA